MTGILKSVAAVWVAVWLVPASVSAAPTHVPLVIDEAIAGRSVTWPVTTGVPFPRGGLRDPLRCRLVDDRGQEQLLQSRVTATWDAAASSIRWLTIDFLAEPGRRYHLEYGPAVRRTKLPSELAIDAGSPAGTTLVRAGRWLFEFRQNPARLARVALDSDGDAVVDDDEVVCNGAVHYYVDGNGERAESRSGGRIVVEESGPLRACIRVDGVYQPRQGEAIVQHRTRYHILGSGGLVRAVHEFRVVGSTRGTVFRDIGLELKLPEASAGRWITAPLPDGQPGQQKVATLRGESASLSSVQQTFRHFGNPICRAAVVDGSGPKDRVLATGKKAGCWMQVGDRGWSITGGLKWFWQQFPKEWEADGDRMVLHLWSPRGGGLDFGRKGLLETLGTAGRFWLLERGGDPGKMNPVAGYKVFAGHAALQRGDVDGLGINKHHEFYLHFHDARSSGDEGIEYGRLVEGPPLALASGQWNCSTDVFGPLAARSGDLETKPPERIVDRIFDLKRYAQDAFGDYGWWIFGSGPHYSYHWDAKLKRHFASAMRFEYHTYQKETQLWWCYLRSGERKFHDWALPSEDHWVDVAVSHRPLKYRCAYRGGRPQDQELHFRPGEWAIDSPLFYLRQRDSAEAWLRGGAQFWASYHRTLETTTLAYYLTGDERYNDVIEYWRDYWGELAGVTSGSQEVKPWYREQPWFVATEPGEPEVSWARMIRDYAPFTSGLRHQMTQFFNLATLYEHTWDKKVGQALRECADVYLDPEHPIGVWRTQENSPPNHAAAPRLAHFWVPALWKYHRVTGDPRMPGVFRKYFAACYGTDPFREDIGQYSNVHIGYAWYYTRDPRHLRPARVELDRLMPLAKPLEKPHDLGRRIYNPYAPIQSLTSVPRLIWALDDASRRGVPVGPPPRMKPQRTPIALFKAEGVSLKLTVWGFDPQLRLVDFEGKPVLVRVLRRDRFATDLQPFDRTTRDFEVYLIECEVPADAAAGTYLLVPGLECAVLSTNSRTLHLNASRPIKLDAGQRAWLPPSEALLRLQSAVPTAWRLATSDGMPIPSRMVPGGLESEVAVVGRVVLQNVSTGGGWFRLDGLAAGKCWVSLDGLMRSPPVTAAQIAAALPRTIPVELARKFVPGRFGQAVPVTEKRDLVLPDHVVADGTLRRLFTSKRGSIEFWIRKLWDDRLAGSPRVTFVDNGLISAWNAWRLPVNEWAHVAVEWRPLKQDSTRRAVHVYVNGHDRKSYRSIWWDGYGRQEFRFPADGKWLKRFLCRASRGAPFLIDELRVSDVPRYTDESIALGHRQLVNPRRFRPPSGRFEPDSHTLLLMRLDGNLEATWPVSKPAPGGRFEAR